MALLTCFKLQADLSCPWVSDICCFGSDSTGPGVQVSQPMPAFVTVVRSSSPERPPPQNN
jgi:hypothetical protein